MTPILPRWVPIGCGTASAVILVLLFIGGSLLTGSHLAEFTDLVIGTSLGELRSMYAPDVMQYEKDRFDTEVERMRAALRDGKVPMQNVQPFMRGMQSSIADKRVTAEELEALTKTAHDAAEGKKKGLK
ncbi:MAG TPA: hypothetical protein VLV78_24140 [Thermoanaerobaculia bacterium]|nr:hypothetical protein [Thermoanaerobaculia bacterium]